LRFKKSSDLLLLISLSIFFFSCSNSLLGLYGIKEVEAISEEKIKHYSKKYNIPLKNSYEMDTSYLYYLFSLDPKKYKKQQQNHIQALQALYYHGDGTLQSFHINSYAHGFPNLDWNQNGIFAEFPPKKQAPLDTLLPLLTHLKYFNKLPESDEINLDSYDFVVVVYWSRFMARQSKRFIKIIQKNCDLAQDQRILIIYANTDNMFSKGKKEK